MVASAGLVTVPVALDLTRYRRDMQRAEREAHNFERRMRRDFGSGSRSLDQLNRSAQRTSRTFMGLAGSVQMVATALGALALYGGTRAFSEFEATLNSVQAVSSATTSEFALLNEKAKELGATTRFTASDVAGAMQFMAMAGLQASTIYRGVESALTLAAAGNMDLAESADIVTNIMTGMGLQASELNRAVDVLTKTFTSTNTNLTQLGAAFKYAAPISATAGVEFEEVAAALGLMGNAGVQASMAGTSMRGILQRLLDPTKEAQEVIKRLGLEIYESDGRMKSLVEIVAQLEPVMQKGASGVSDLATVFGARPFQGMAALVRQGSGALAELTGKLREADGWAGHIAEVQMRGLRGAFYNLKSAAEALAISIGESGLGKAFEVLTQSTANALRVMNQWVASTADVQNQGLGTLTTTVSQLNEQLARVDEQLARNRQNRASGVREFLGGFGSTSAIKDLEDRRKAILDQIAPLEEFIRLQRQLANTGVKAVRQVEAVPEDDLPPGAPAFDEAASKREQALQQLQALEVEYLRSTRQNRRLIQVEYENELARFQKMLDQKIISESEFTDARIHLMEITAARMKELDQESMRFVQDIGSAISSGLEGAFRSFIEEGKIDFNELTRSILADIATISLRMHVLQPLFGGGPGGGGGIFASLFAHGGAMVGSSGSRRMVHPAAFLGAPRLHGGGQFLRSDERPAILQTGERVLSRGQTRDADKGVVVQIVNNTGADIKQEEGRTSDGRELRRFIVQEMNSSILRGKTDGSMRRRFGNQPVGTRR